MAKNKKQLFGIFAVIIVCILILGVCVSAALTQGFTNADPYGWLSKDKQAEQGEEQQNENNDGDVIVQTVEFVAPLRLSAKSTSVNSGVVLTATISPESAADQNVTWSLAWAETNSWSNGKNPSDYVNIVQSDDPLVVTVSAKQAFGAKINVVCTSTFNTNAKATCTVGYGQRWANPATAKFIYPTYDPVSMSTASTTTIKALKSGYYPYSSLTFTLNEDHANVYTDALANVLLGGTNAVKVYVKPTDEFQTALKNGGYAKNSTAQWTEVARENSGYSVTAINVLKAHTTVFDESSLSNVQKTNKYNQMVYANKGAYDFDIKFVVTTQYETVELVFPVKYDRSDSVFSVSSVTLSTTSITF